MPPILFEAVSGVFQYVFVRRQLRLLRIRANVVLERLQLFRVSHNVVITLSHPKWSLHPQLPVDRVRSETLPSLRYLPARSR